MTEFFSLKTFHFFINVLKLLLIEEFPALLVKLDIIYEINEACY